MRIGGSLAVKTESTSKGKPQAIKTPGYQGYTWLLLPDGSLAQMDAKLKQLIWAKGTKLESGQSRIDITV